MTEEQHEIDIVENPAESDQKQKKQRKRQPFPQIPYEDALEIAKAIWTYASGQKIRRLTLFDHLKKSPDSGPSRALITISSKYGLTTGGYQAEYIELTDLGAKATNPDLNSKEKYQAQFNICIGNNDYFKKLYEQYKDMKLPSTSVMVDSLMELGLSKEDSEQCINVFILNCKYLNILQVFAGAERILNFEHWLEQMNIPSQANSYPNSQITQSDNDTEATEETIKLSNNQEDICFFIAPIGDENSEQRKHSDLFLNHLVEPALKDLNLKVVRADSINEAGLITAQIIHLLKSAKLVVADLSYHNPNVFYELAYRHTLNLPTIHIIRKVDSIPFDINDFRTITIDDTDIYSLVPQLETFRRQIASQAKNLLENVNEVKNPISSMDKK